MDIKKVGQFDNLADIGGKGKVPSASTGGPSFGSTLEQALGKLQNQAEVQKPIAAQAGAMANGADAVKFSNHAVERMMSRGISFSQADMQKLNDAVGRAANKGSKDSLILMNDSALIVSVKNKTVVTVMDKTALKDNVFTNIDSTIVM